MRASLAISPLSALAPTRGDALLRPPPGFLPLTGCTAAWEAKNPHRDTRRRRKTGAQLAGLRYEKAAKEWLNAAYNDPERLKLGPWLYARGSRSGYCQPDALISSGGWDRPERITIVEIKACWSLLAWWQLTARYAPVVQRLYQPNLLRLVCLTRSFDPFISTPEASLLIHSLDAALPESPFVGVYLWRP